MKYSSSVPRLAAVLCGLLISTRSSFAQGSAFTYQGRLGENGAAANGLYDLSFSAWVAASGPSQVGGTLSTNGVAVSNGLFTVTLDFGPGMFTGPDRWLEIGVRTNGGGAFATLIPRQKLTATPYAITAGNLTGVVPNAGVGGTYSSAVTLSNPANSFTGNGGGLTNVNALTLGGIGNNGFWRTTGNAGTTAGPNFLGTTDNQPLEIRVNGTRALRIETGGGAAASLIGGYFQNNAGGFHGAVVAGGGTSGSLNEVLGNYGFVGAGHGGKAGNYSAVVAGAYNSAPGSFSFIGSGQGNTNRADYSVIGGGTNNLVQSGGGGFSTIAGGSANVVSRNSTYGTVGGGIGNVSDGLVTTVGGGQENHSVGTYDTVGGGFQNISSGSSSTVAGGYANTSSGPGATIGGGSGNLSTANYTTVAGGVNNSGSGDYATVGGGQQNYAGIDHATVAGGLNNTVTAGGGFIGGGNNNAVNDLNGMIGGGIGNSLNGNAATISGGYQNLIGSVAAGSVIGGGVLNMIQTKAANATIGGGYVNVIQTNAYNSTISGGDDNTVEPFAVSSVIGGGSYNAIQANAQHSTLGGGEFNLIGNDAAYATIGGGHGHSIQAGSTDATISGGEQNTIGTTAAAATIAGGKFNLIDSGAAYSAIAGGSNNAVQAAFSFVAGGQSNLVDSTSLWSAIGGGRNNRIRAGITFLPTDICTIGGGADNLIDHHEFPFDLTSASTIGGGQGNTIQLGYAQTIAGGFGNQVGSFQGGTVSGGEYNTIGGDYGTVPGGLSNSAVGDYSLAAGRQAKANHRGSFVWADSDSADFASTADDQFSLRARGGVRISDNTPNLSFGSTTRQMLMLWGGLYGVGVQASTLYFRTGSGTYDGFAWYQGGVHNDNQFDAGTGGTQLMRLDKFGLTVNGTFVSASDRNSKENFEPVNSREVLDKVAALPLSRWNYKLDGSSRHLGPMAQDFYAAFGVGPDDKHIATVDADGVALAAIQGLNQKLEERLEQKDAEIAELKRAVAELNQLVRNAKP